MTNSFDLIAIGTGTAASTVAYKCRSAGWDVAVIDSRPFGGTCALRGCDPKKVLIGIAELIDWNTRMAGKGIVADDIHIDWSSLMRFKKTFTEPVPKSREKGFTKAGIKMFHGKARFINKNTIKVNNDSLSGRHILIATGSEPAKLNIPGEEYLTTSDEFLELEKLPKRITFVGGGYISFELAHIAILAGAQVNIIHKNRRPLEGFDPDLVDQLVKATIELGVDIQLNSSVDAIEKDSDQYFIHTSGKNIKKTIETDIVIHGAGRMPEIDDLDLEKAAISKEKKGISVNSFLQSVSNPVVYAAGDAAASEGLPLTPVAAMEGHVVASNMLKGNNRKPDYTGTPTVVFTIPPLASVGLHEKAASTQGLKFRTNYKKTSNWFSSRNIGIKDSGFKVLIEEESDLILGAHLWGSHSEEVINIFALAIRNRLDASDLKTLPYAYPTSTSDISYMV